MFPNIFVGWPKCRISAPKPPTVPNMKETEAYSYYTFSNFSPKRYIMAVIIAFELWLV